MKCRTLVDMPNRGGVMPAGAEIEHPQAFRLVQQGMAEPADDECRERVGQSSSSARATIEAAADQIGRHVTD